MPALFCELKVFFHTSVIDSVQSREERCKEEEGRRLVVELVAVDDSGRLTNEKFWPSP